MTNRMQWLTILGLLASAAIAQAQEADKPIRKLYVPYRDLAAAVDPSAKTVLMDRKAFGKLLAKARANEKAVVSVELGQVTVARYDAQVNRKSVTVTGAMTVMSMSDKPVAVDLGFAKIAITKITLD